MIRKVFQVIKKRELRNIVKNEQIYTFLINETIISVDGYKFTDKDGLDFTFIWVHDRGDRRGAIRDGRNTRRVREELVLRIQNGGLTTQYEIGF